MPGRYKWYPPAQVVANRCGQVYLSIVILCPLILSLAFGEAISERTHAQVPASTGEPHEDRQQPATAKWVPFSAKLHYENTPDIRLHLPGKTVMEGPYLRNEQGSSYQRVRVISKTSVPVIEKDVATIVDRPKGLVYLIDYSHRTVEIDEEAKDELFLQAKDYFTAEQFVTLHASDEYLGKREFEGFACEAYKVSWRSKRNKLYGEICYAPALNYDAIHAQVRLPSGGSSDISLREIKVGQIPGPEYFQIPEGFKLVKKEKQR